MKNIAIIPGKQNSQRCPGKNFRDFCGRPIVEWTIDAAKGSGLFDIILLIHNIPNWIQYHSPVNRIYSFIKEFPDELYKCPVDALCEWTLNEYNGYDNFCLLLATAPMRDNCDIAMAYHKMFVEDCDGIMAVTKFIQPWWQMLTETDKNLWSPYFKSMTWMAETNIKKSALVDNGSMYWVRVKEFLEQKTFYLNRLGVYEMPYERSIDINTETDFEMAEMFGRKFLKFN